MKVTADFIFTDDGRLTKDLCVVTNDDGTITSFEPDCNDPDTIRYEGIILPGLFNCHAHIEFADADFGNIHSLDDFLKKMKRYQLNRSNHPDRKSIFRLDEKLFAQGIEFCADISNTDFTIDIKEKSRVHYFSFVEVFETLFDDPEKKFEQALSIMQKFIQRNLSASLVPHSIYSVSNKMINLLSIYNQDNKNISSIHFKESFKENDLKSFQKLIYNIQNNNKLEKYSQKFSPTESLTILKQIFSQDQRVLFVHNIYMNEKERKWLSTYQKNCGLCICPTSNLNIEKKMTDIHNIQIFKHRVFLGTDSPASNPKMSLVNEMYLMQKQFQLVPEEIFKMVTIDPATFFQMQKKGKISPGQKPGLVLLSQFNYRKMQFTQNSRSVRIL